MYYLNRPRTCGLHSTSSWCTAVSKNKVSSVQCFAADNRDDVIPYISNWQTALSGYCCVHRTVQNWY